MNTPHKYANVIKAWADGKPIQYYSEVLRRWMDWVHPFTPYFASGEWRMTLIHQEAHEHYCNGGDVICRFKNHSHTPGSVWKASDATEDSKTDPRWNHPNYEFTILPKSEVRYMMVLLGKPGTPGLVVNGTVDGVNQSSADNLKLTFEGEKLVKAEVIG